MAWTTRLSSGKWRGAYRIPTGQIRYTKPHTHQAAALREAAAAEGESRSLGWRDPQAAARTWGDWCSEWSKSRNLAPSTAKDEALTIKNHLIPRWGDTPLIDITRHDIKAWATELGATRAPSTVHKIVTALSVSLAAAVDAEILPANPAQRLKLPTPDAAPERYLTKDEQARLIEAHTQPLAKALTTILIDSGLRWGEATALTLAHIDIDKRTIRVRAAWSAGELVPHPKGKQRRTVPLTDRAAAAILSIAPKDPNRLIFSYDGRNQLDIDSWRTRHDNALKAAGIEPCRIHDLRHTYASTLIQAGIPLAEVGRLLGHKSPLTTQRYAHLAEVPSAAVLTALDPTPDPAPQREAKVKQSGTRHDPNPPARHGAEIINFPTKRQIRR